MSGLLRATRLAGVLAARTLTATLQLEHTPLISDGRGGYVPGTPVLTTIQGLIRPSGNSATEQQIADRLGGRSLWIIEVPLGTDVSGNDRISEPASGRSFEVTQALEATDLVTLPIACVEHA